MTDKALYQLVKNYWEATYGLHPKLMEILLKPESIMANIRMIRAVKELEKGK